MEKDAEILISAFRVTHPSDEIHRTLDTYEFILNKELRIMGCLKVVVPLEGIRKNILLQENNGLEDLLFELHHVRVNPKRDNSIIIQSLTTALNNIGVSIHKQPDIHDMRICYKPLGEIDECVRFYLSHGRKIVFLCPTKGPRLKTYHSHA